jgi:hypothetical protein
MTRSLSFKRRRPHPYRHVDTLADHVDRAIGRFEMYRDARGLRHESCQHRPHACVQQRYRAGQPDNALRLGAVEFDRLLRRLRLDQHGLAVAVVALPDFCDRETPCRALNEPHAEVFLEQGDSPAESGLRDAQRAPGRRKPLIFDDLRKEIKIVEILHRMTRRSIRETQRIAQDVYRTARRAPILLPCKRGRRDLHQELKP